MMKKTQRLGGSLSAFFLKASSLFAISAVVLVDFFPLPAEAAVVCRGRDRAERVARAQIVNGGGTGGQRSFELVGTKSATLMLNGNVDLDIAPDINVFAHGDLVNETTAWLWQVSARDADGLTGYITATYQFNGLVSGDNKICISASSCIQVTNIVPETTRLRRWGDDNDPNNSISSTRQRIFFEMDLSGVTESGVYVGNLEMTLSIGPNIDGSGSVSLTCDSIILS